MLRFWRLLDLELRRYRTPLETRAKSSTTETGKETRFKVIEHVWLWNSPFYSLRGAWQVGLPCFFDQLVDSTLNKRKCAERIQKREALSYTLEE